MTAIAAIEGHGLRIGSVTIGVMLLAAALLIAPRTFTNPIAPGADPCLQYYKGWYYLSVTTGRDVKIRRAKRIGDLDKAEAVTVYRSDAPDQKEAVWAPEFHRFGGKWYLYFTATAGPEPGHRMFVAEGTGDTPIGPYRFKAKLLTDPKDEFYAIDGHPFRTADGKLYFAWCGRPSETGQGLFLSRMTNPWTLEGPRLSLPVDGFGCKYVREGPETLQRDGKTFLVYSACGADTPDYRLGMTILPKGGNPLDPSAWKQWPKPIFERNDAAGVYGPGHDFFFRSPDGKEDWHAYHAKPSTRLDYAERNTRAGRVTWREGVPDLGAPVATGVPVPVPSGER